MATPTEPLRGLSAAELAAACGELQALVGAAAGTTVVEAVPLAVPADADDLLLILQHGERKLFLHIAPGGNRARLSPTDVRFPASAFAKGVRTDLLQKALAGAVLRHVGSTPGERRCALGFATANGDRRLVVELFGARGLWALLDAEGRILVLSRPVQTAVRVLQPGDAYAPPPAAPAAASKHHDEAMRFAPPVLPAIDALYAAFDAAADQRRQYELLLRAAQRALQRAQQQVRGIEQQLADGGRAAALRAEADWMLAYQHTVRRGAEAMSIPDPNGGDTPLTIALDPALPVVVQAQKRYEKARRLDDGRQLAEQRLATAAAEAALLAPLVEQLTALTPGDQDLPTRLAPLRAALRARGVVVKDAAAAAPKPKPKHTEPLAGENFRRFVSAEGYPIWVGRNNEQNDRLSMRVANGNDLWLHVGGGRAGSHVIVRLPKQKTASLETLLDAATLAVHFSKARGEHRIEVIYTWKKHIRKPKGLPPGAVVPSQTKTVTVQRDEERLARLLASQPDNDG
jgi:predicted ribosome quality control (RQC) complex YloA/Tae2 family protein